MNAYKKTLPNNKAFGLLLSMLMFVTIMALPSKALDFVPLEVCVLGAVPPTPTNLSATDGEYLSKVVVTYDTSICASSYYIYRNIPDTLWYVLIGTTTGGTFEDTSASPGTTYNYKVRSENANGSSAYSNSDSGYILQLSVADELCLALPPSAPENISATDGTYPDQIVISDYTVNCATSYDIYRALSAGGAKILIADNTTDTSYTDTSVVPDQTYYYFVIAYNSWGASDYSDYDAGTATADPEPVAPSNFAASQGTYPDRIELTWDAVAGAEGYKIFRNTSGTGVFSQINWPSSGGTSYTDTNVDPGETYYYIIKSIVGGADSSNSNVISGYTEDAGSSSSAATVPDVPSSIVASDGEYSDKITLTIAEVAEATQYDIYRSESVADYGIKIGSSSSHLTADTSAIAGVVYYYRVQACNASGCSDYSMPDSGYLSASEPEQTMEEIVADVLTSVGSYTINGTFGQHDFADAESAFDWAYTVAGGSSYQLQGNAPTANDVFGWKEAMIPTPVPMWYMFSLAADVDGDGNQKFDWILVYVDTNSKSVYKLAGVTAEGFFDYSEAIDVDYSISADGKTVTFTAP